MAAAEHAQVVDDPIEVRRNKREALLAAGQHPYGQRFDVSAHAAQLEERYAGLEDGQSTNDVVAIAGRIMAVRRQGKVVFMTVKDASGTMQLFIRINNVGEQAFEHIKALDVGDWVGTTGAVMRTRRGQLSVASSEVVLLSKALRPLPEKFHGLTDKELRYRQRYVDLTVNDDVKDVFVKRSRIISAFRRYMEGEGYLEMETPMLQTVQGGATARPFITHFNALDQECYLRIATELHLKRLLVGGFERVYEIGRIFRNEGMDATHNPEFTSMEAYAAFGDLSTMKQLAQGVIQYANAAVNGSEQLEYQGTTIDLSGEWLSIPMTQVVSDALGQHVDLDTPRETLAQLAADAGIEVKDEWTSGKLIAELYDEVGEPTLVNPTFVVDYPVEVSPLAKRKADDERLTDRFELVIAGHEYANAFSELNDPVDQAARFQAQMEEKAIGDAEAMEYDTDYVRALEYGMPPAGGIGIGIDRVVMLLTDQAAIRDVLLFPHMRPEK